MGPESNRSAQSLSAPQITLEQVSITLGLAVDRRGKVLRPGTRVMEDCSWEIQAGERWALTGPPGSGKTTLLRLLNGLIYPTQGRVQWQGNPYRQIPIAQLRRQILYVPQDPKLLGMTALDAIAYPLKLQDRPSSEITQRCNDIINQLEIPSTWLDQPEVQLSQNQRQWVALARALALQPAVLLFDQPTALLDPIQIQCLQTALDRPSNRSRTLIITSYSPETIQLTTDHCYRLDSYRLDSYRLDTRQGWLSRSEASAEDSIDDNW